MFVKAINAATVRTCHNGCLPSEVRARDVLKGVTVLFRQHESRGKANVIPVQWIPVVVVGALVVVVVRW